MKSVFFILSFFSFTFAQGKMICFIFCGHSNMNGHCSIQDTTKNKQVFIFKDGAFKLADDLDYAGDNNESGSPVIPFLKRMALLYPGYSFCGIKMASSCAQAWHRGSGDSKFAHLCKQIDELKGKMVFGGVLMMYGYIEGQDSAQAENLDVSIYRLLSRIRTAVENKTLPCIVGRYEINGNNTLLWDTYHKWNETLVNRLNSMQNPGNFVAVTPFRPIPKEYYCDSHHYTAEGYQIWSEQAADMVQINNFDFWRSEP